MHWGHATSIDGYDWTFDRIVLPNRGERDVRDPKVGRVPHGDGWYMVLGAGSAIRFCVSDNIVSWRPGSTIDCRSWGFDGIVECPDLFAAPSAERGDPVWLLTVSILNRERPPVPATWAAIGTFDGSQFRPRDGGLGLPDHGINYYAQQTRAELPGATRPSVAALGGARPLSRLCARGTRSSPSRPAGTPDPSAVRR